MFVIGAHLTIAKGFSYAAKATIEMNGDTFQFFCRNPRGSKTKEYDKNDLALFNTIIEENKFGPIMAHAPYTLNLASANNDVYAFSKAILKEDIQRMNSIGVKLLNIHPGSHIGSGIDTGIERIIEGINFAMSGSENITILLETMSGKGSEIGGDFYQLKRILDGLDCKKRLGVCMDLCHVYSAGYDIANKFESVLNEFDAVLGIERLKAVHLNDSMMPFNSRKDRHVPIGKGYIGLEPVIKIMNHKYMRGLPFYLETPLDNEGHRKEIEMLRNHGHYI